MARASHPLMCPHCGAVMNVWVLVPAHDFDGEACPGGGQYPRCAESDGRRLWNGQPNPHYYRNQEA